MTTPQLPPFSNPGKHTPQQLNAANVALLSKQLGEWVDPNKVVVIPRSQWTTKSS